MSTNHFGGASLSKLIAIFQNPLSLSCMSSLAAISAFGQPPAILGLHVQASDAAPSDWRSLGTRRFALCARAVGVIKLF